MPTWCCGAWLLVCLAGCTVDQEGTSTTFASASTTMGSPTSAGSASDTSDGSGSGSESSGGEASEAEASTDDAMESGPGESSGGGHACGDGTKDATEMCDGTDVGGESCAGLGLGGGPLGCLVDCSGFDTSGCMMQAMCGDNTKDGVEQCDGADLGGQNCTSLGFDMGVLACSAMCQFNTAGCSDMVCAPEFSECSDVPCCEDLFCYPFDPPYCGPTP